MIIFKIFITVILLAVSIYLDVYKRKGYFVCMVFYISFLTMLMLVFEALFDWPDLLIIATCLLIYAGILLVVRKKKMKMKDDS